MSRWEPDSRGRLAKSALSLYGEKGFENTTVAEIASAAGVTERTFFRHFADKREVLFSGGEELRDAMASALAEAPAALAPVDAVAIGLAAGAAVLQGRREFAGLRQQIIAANAELQERELIKLASIAAAMTAALGRRGVAEPVASLAAEVGIAVFRVAFDRWADGADQEDLSTVIRESLDELKAVTAGV